MKPRMLQKQYLQQQQRKSRQRLKTALIASALGLLVLGVVLYATTRRPEQVLRPDRMIREQPPTPTSSPIEDSTLPSPAETNAIFAKIKTFRDAVAAVTRGHAEGEELVRIFDEHHLPSYVDAGGAVRALKTMRLGRLWFSVVVRDPAPRLGTLAAMHYDVPQRILYVTNRAVTESWMGFVGAHELIHVRDGVTGYEPPQQAGSAEWVAGEVRAYDMEIELIDRWTQGAFISKLAELAPTAERRFGYQNWTEEYHALDSLFPPALGETERGVRDGLFSIALAFAVGASHHPEDLFLEKIRRYKLVTGH